MITPDNPYFPQVRLLVAVLPFVAREGCFALKGGTAINLFVRDMPRLSVDIDLAFLPIGDRAAALAEIGAALEKIRTSLERASPSYRVSVGKRQAGHACGLLVSSRDAEIKIEVSPVLRGSVFPEAMRRIVPAAEEQFGFAEVRTLSFEDIFAGKIVAALDRQHPRDLFDVKLLLEAEGLSGELFRAFLVYLISHDGSLARVINPAPKPLEDLYERQFRNMSAEPVSLPDLKEARTALLAALHRRMGQAEKDFLLSFKRGEPRWELLGVTHAPNLPAVRWKLHNLAAMEATKRNEAIRKLETTLAGI